MTESIIISAATNAAPVLAPGGHALHPIVILGLCVGAGLGTVMMLPGNRETSWRKVGGALALAILLILGAWLIRFASQLNLGGMNPYFWCFSAIAIISAVRVITHAKPVYSALYFVLTVVASSGLFILLWAEFIAAALVIIYAGAILITYVFVIMLAQQGTLGEEKAVTGLAEYDEVSRDPVVAAAIGFALMGVLMFVIFDKADGMKAYSPAGTKVANLDGDGEIKNTAEYDGSTQQLGYYLFHDQLVNLELAGLILTISMVGAIVIARRRIVSTDTGDELVEASEPEMIDSKPVNVNDDPHSIPVYGTRNPAAKAYPET